MVQRLTKMQEQKRYPRRVNACSHVLEYFGGSPVYGIESDDIERYRLKRTSRTSKWVQMVFSDEIIRRATGHSTLEAYQNYVKLDQTAVMSLVSEKRYKHGINLSQRQ